MKKLLLLLFIFWGSVLLSPLQAQISWESFFEKADKQWNSGKYEKALSKAKKNQKIIDKKLNQNAIYKAWIMIYEAQINQIQGQYLEMQTQLIEANKILDVEQNVSPDVYLIAKCKMADIQIELGNYLETQNKLKELSEFTKSAPITDDFLNAELANRQIQTLYHLGFLNETLSELPKITETWNTLANADTGTWGKLGKNDKSYRQVQTARMMTLYGKVLTEKGLYSQADSALNAAEKQINRLTSDPTVLASQTIAQGNNAFDKEDYKQAEKDHEKALGIAKKSPYYQLKSLEKALNSYIYGDKGSSFDKQIKEYTKVSVSNFKKGAVYGYQEDLLNGKMKFEEGAGTEALSFFLQVWEAPKTTLPLTHPLRLEVLDQLYYLYTELTPNPEKARIYLDSSLIIREQAYGKKSIYYQVYQVKLANYLFERGNDFEEIRKLLKDEPYLAIFEQRSDLHKDYTNIANTVAKYFELIDRYQDALQKIYRTTELTIQKFGEKDIKTAMQLSRQADLELKVGKYKEAEQSAEKSLQIIKKELPKRSAERADALALMAKIYGTLGSYREAESLLRTSDRIYRRLGIEDFTQRGRSIDEMAFLYILIGKYAQIEELLQQDISQKEAKYGRDSYHLITSLNNLGQLYLIKGDYKTAELYAQHAEKIAKDTYGKDNSRTVGSYQLLSQYYATIGDYERAKEYLNQVLTIQKKQLGEEHVEVARSYAELGLLQFYEDKKQAPNALQLIEKAKGIMAKNFDTQHPLYAEVLKTQGIILLENAQYNEAFKVLAQANQIWLAKLGDQNLNSAEAYSLMGDVYAFLKRFDEARTNYASAEAIYKKVLSKNHPDYINTQSKLGRMYFVSGDNKEANKILESTTQAYLDFIKTYFPALSEREKEKFWNKIKPDFEFYNTLAISQAAENPSLLENMYNFQLATKALLLSSSVKVRQSILNSNDAKLKELFIQWARKKEELTQILAMSDAELIEEEISPVDLRNEINQIEKELSSRSDLFAGAVDTELYTWKDVKKSLAKNEAAVEMIRFRKYENGFLDDKIYYAALIITPQINKSPELVLLENGADLEGKYLRYYRNATQYDKNDKYSYAEFWQAIHEKLKEYPIVYLSPDGVYNQVNVQALRITDETFVIDEKEVRLVSNTKDLLTMEKNESRKMKRRRLKEEQDNEKEIVLIGNPTFYASESSGLAAKVADLPGTELELQKIKELFQDKLNWHVSLYNRKLADEDTLKNIKNPRILHISTHGFFKEPETSEANLTSFNSLKNLQDDPLRNTGVLMRGAGDLLAEDSNIFDRVSGILTAYEAMNLSFEDTDLVVLSACETGLGKVAVGEGVYGLQRAFLVAGADAIIMSLFKVDDEVTQELMISFYTKWLESGNKRTAFTEAQKTIKERYQKPSLWGAFVMVGVK